MSSPPCVYLQNEPGPRGYSVDNIARIQNRPIYGLNVNVSLVMEFLDMTLKGETFSRIVSNFCLDGLCIFTKCNDFLKVS